MSVNFCYLQNSSICFFCSGGFHRIEVKVSIFHITKSPIIRDIPCKSTTKKSSKTQTKIALPKVCSVDHQFFKTPFEWKLRHTDCCISLSDLLEPHIKPILPLCGMISSRSRSATISLKQYKKVSRTSTEL